MSAVILIPGFWLDASSWDDIVPAIEDAGHFVRALTLPGLESRSADRSRIGLRDHVEAVVAALDEIPGPVALVGHSGGGAIAHAAADARPEKVSRVVYVDSVPLGHGKSINSELPVFDGQIPLPEWSLFDEEDLRDLDDGLREMLRARAIPQPAAVATDPQTLYDERRYEIPVTVVACEYSSGQLREWMAEGEPTLAELAAVHDVEYVDLPTGHWPQFTKPRELSEVLVRALDR
jgi:pimeloyl-ACP methyl ester carboxylesterase